MTVKQLFDNARDRLAAKKSASEARETVIIIFENIKKWTLTDILVKGDDQVSEWLIEQVDNAVKRILDDEPVQYVFGNAHFYGMTLKVTPAVLIPRPETAQLVDLIVDGNRDRTDLKVLDVATGSGCIAIALARNLKFATVDAFDISPDALAVATENNRELKTRVNFSQGDILSLLPVKTPIYDIIVSNPPYITLREAETMEANVLDHEPSIALFVPDNDPLKFYLPTTQYALTALKPGGHLYLEINPDYAAMLKKEMISQGWNEVDIQRDMQGHERFIIAQP